MNTFNLSNGVLYGDGESQHACPRWHTVRTYVRIHCGVFMRQQELMMQVWTSSQSMSGARWGRGPGWLLRPCTAAPSPACYSGSGPAAVLRLRHSSSDSDSGISTGFWQRLHPSSLSHSHCSSSSRSTPRRGWMATVRELEQNRPRP